METQNLSQINAVVESAFAAMTALPQAEKVAPQPIGNNATLRTDTYTGPKGSGFVVAATVDLPWRTLVIAKQHGPETWREQPLPTADALLAECREERASRYEAEASVYDLADAETKLASSDPAVQAEGAVQKAAVLAKRLEIKASVQKPQGIE